MNNFSKRLKEARKEKGISQRGLGLALGLSDKTISSYESNRSLPNLEILRKLSEVLNKPVEYFISSRSDVLIQNLLNRIEINQQNISKELGNIKKIIRKVE